MTKRILVEIPEQQYNNIIALDSACLGRIPYKGIVMYAVNAIKNGIPLPNEHGFIAICKTDDLMSEEIEKEIKETLFIASETYSYCYEITEIIKNGKRGAMSEYIKIKRRLYDELVETKAKYVELCGALELCRKVYENNKPVDKDICENMAIEHLRKAAELLPIMKVWP